MARGSTKKKPAAIQPKTSFILFDTWCDLIMALSDEQAGALFKGLFLHNRGQEPELDGMTEAIYNMCSNAMDISAAKYRDRCKRADAARKAKAKKASNISSNINSNISSVYEYESDNEYVNGYESDNESVYPSESVYAPPTLEEVTDYINSKGYKDLDAEYIHDWYTANGWKDVDGLPIRNWKRLIDKAAMNDTNE